MKAVLLEEPERFTAIDIAEPSAPAAGEALVQVHRVGVCGTDVAAYRGKMPLLSYPRILGHELGVEVLALGDDVTNVAVGDRCCVEPYLNCGDCFACRRGGINCCERLEVLGVHTDGGLRPRFLVPARKLHSSTKLSLEQLALVETLSIGAHAVRRAQLVRCQRKRESGAASVVASSVAAPSVAVVGAGPIGLSVVAFAQQAGASVTVIDRDERRLAFCADTMRVDETVVAAKNDTADDLANRLRAVGGGDLPSVVFDATGNPDSMAGAFDLVAPTGKLVFVGLTGAEVTFRPAHMHVREMTLLSSRNALPQDFAQVMAALESGSVATDPWITHHTTLDTFIDDFPTYTDPASGVIKAIVEVS